MRLLDCLRLRVKDIDFHRREIVISSGKGEKDRLTMVPDLIVDQIKLQIQQVKKIHNDDLRQSFGEVYLPYALATKYQNEHYRPWATIPQRQGQYVIVFVIINWCLNYGPKPWLF